MRRRILLSDGVNFDANGYDYVDMGEAGIWAKYPIGISEWTSETSPTAIMPDYDSNFAGVIGAIIVMALIWGISSVIFSNIKKSHIKDPTEEI